MLRFTDKCNLVIKGEFVAITDYICMLHHEWADKDVNKGEGNITVWQTLWYRSFDGLGWYSGGTLVVLFCIQNDINFNINWLRFFTVSVISSLLYLNTYMLI